MPADALIVDKKDNVATAVRQLEKGTAATMQAGDSDIRITLTQPVPFGHKFALRNIQKGEPVIKYGEVIGLASAPIATGQHVHVHNIEGRKGRGDRI